MAPSPKRAEAPRIVALPGFLGRASDWAPLRDALHEISPATAFEALEWPWHEPSAIADSPAEWAADFNRRPRGAAREVLLGYSMGGRMALHAAFADPARWDAVAIVSAHPGGLGDAERQQRRALDADWAARFETLPWPGLMAAWGGQAVFAGSTEPDRHEADYARAALAKVLVRWSGATYDLPPDALARARLHAYAGIRDAKYVQLLSQFRDRKLIRSLHVVEGAGHRLIFDRPAELARLLAGDVGLPATAPSPP